MINVTKKEPNSVVEDQQGLAPPGGPPRKIISMRFIISAVTVSLIAVAVVGFGSLAERNTRRTLSQEIESRLILEARNLASSSTDALLSDFPELTLCPLVSEIQQKRDELALVAVLDHEQKVQGHIDLQVLDKDLHLTEGMEPRETANVLRPGEKGTYLLHLPHLK